MLTSLPLKWRLAALGGVAFVFLPLSRGPLLLVAVAALIFEETRRVRTGRGPRIEVRVDGQLHRLPAEGGTVRFGDVEVPVRRDGEEIAVGDLHVAVGDVVYRGSSMLEVLR